MRILTFSRQEHFSSPWFSFSRFRGHLHFCTIRPSFHFMQIKYLISIFWPLIMHNKCPIKLFYWHEICSKRFNSLRYHWKLVSLQIFDVHSHSRSIPRGNIHKMLNAFVHAPAHKIGCWVLFSPFCALHRFSSLPSIQPFNVWQYSRFNLVDALLYQRLISFIRQVIYAILY